MQQSHSSEEKTFRTQKCRTHSLGEKKEEGRSMEGNGHTEEILKGVSQLH